MLTCRSSTVMTYKYMRSPCIFRLPGGGFQPLIVNTFRHCKGYRRTEQKQFLSAGINTLELQSHSMYMPDFFYLPPSLGSRNRAYKNPGLESTASSSRLQSPELPQSAAFHIVRHSYKQTPGASGLHQAWISCCTGFQMAASKPESKWEGMEKPRVVCSDLQILSPGLCRATLLSLPCHPSQQDWPFHTLQRS